MTEREMCTVLYIPLESSTWLQIINTVTDKQKAILTVTTISFTDKLRLCFFGYKITL